MLAQGAADLPERCNSQAASQQMQLPELNAELTPDRPVGQFSSQQGCAASSNTRVTIARRSDRLGKAMPHAKPLGLDYPPTQTAPNIEEEHFEDSYTLVSEDETQVGKLHSPSHGWAEGSHNPDRAFQIPAPAAEWWVSALEAAPGPPFKAAPGPPFKAVPLDAAVAPFKAAPLPPKAPPRWYDADLAEPPAKARSAEQGPPAKARSAEAAFPNFGPPVREPPPELVGLPAVRCHCAAGYGQRGTELHGHTLANYRCIRKARPFTFFCTACTGTCQCACRGCFATEVDNRLGEPGPRRRPQDPSKGQERDDEGSNAVHRHASSSDQ
jgi:hypothetical protein